MSNVFPFPASKICLTFILFGHLFFWGKSQDSLYFMAKAYLSYNQTDSAYFFVNEAIKKNTNDIHYWLLKGDILFAQKHWDGAINSYRLVEKYKPEWVNYQLAKCYSQTGNFAETEKYLKRYLEQRKRIESYKVKLDTCFKQFAHTKQWEKLWMNDFDNNFQDFLKQVEYNIRYEHYEEALEQIDNYLVNHQKKYYLYFLKGNILQIMNDNNSALASYERAYQLKPKDTAIANAYGHLLITLKKNKKAQSVFVQLNKNNKYSLSTLKAIGITNYNLKKYKKAQEELSDYVKFYYKDPEANFYLAKVYFAQKAYFNALKAINISIQEDPNNFDYLFTRGKIYLESQAYSLAKKDFLLSMDISTKNAGELFFLIGVCYQHMGDPGMACSYWKRAYEHQYMDADEYRMKFCQ